MTLAAIAGPALIVAASMLLKDLLYNAATLFVAREQAALAATFDAAGDIASLFTFSVGAATFLQHGILSAYTAAILAAMVAGSYGGAFAGVRVAQLIERRVGTPAPHRLKLIPRIGPPYPHGRVRASSESL